MSFDEESSEIGSMSFCLWPPDGSRWHAAVCFGKAVGTALNYHSRIVPTFRVIVEKQAGPLVSRIDKGGPVIWRLSHAIRTAKRVVAKVHDAIGYVAARPERHEGEWLGCPSNGFAIMPAGAPLWIADLVGKRVREHPQTSSYLGGDGRVHSARFTAYHFEWFQGDAETHVKAIAVDPEMVHLPPFVPAWFLMGSPTQDEANKCARDVMAAAVAAHRTGADVDEAMHAVYSKYEDPLPDGDDEHATGVTV